MNWRIAVVVFCLYGTPAVTIGELVEGQDYVVINAQPIERGERIEVIEFFYYGCRSCYLLEPLLRDWVVRRSAQIDFRLIPALRRSEWVPLSAFFFALHSLELIPLLHDRVYVAIHEQNRRLSSRSEQIRWVREQGVDSGAMEAALDSDAIAIATQNAKDATQVYGISATPSIVFDGRYLTTGEMIGNASRVFHVLDGLFEMVLAGRDGASQ
ncbi:MAG: thiol:disulfide interchange protein DsbA/DsbL [Burkholderiales bacterium]|nr:thiol:disulfide interchange protein DsbA/DsbL [Burkholderiales bacterium]